MKNAKPSGRAKTSGKKHGKKKNRRPLPLRILGTVGSVILVSFLSFFLLFCVTGAICAVVATNYMINYDYACGLPQSVDLAQYESAGSSVHS